MNENQIKEVLQGYINGKEIQVYDKYSKTWKDKKNFECWEFDCTNYRIKPEKEYRPYKNIKEFLESVQMFGTKIYDKDGEIIDIENISNNGITYRIGLVLCHITWQDMVNDLCFKNFHPCGVLIIT